MPRAKEKPKPDPMAPIKSPDFKQVKVSGKIWARRVKDPSPFAARNDFEVYADGFYDDPIVLRREIGEALFGAKQIPLAPEAKTARIYVRGAEKPKYVKV